MKKIIWVGLIALCVGLWSFTGASDNNKIFACVNKEGLTRVVGQGNVHPKCRKNETELVWNVQGLEGPEGEPGLSAMGLPDTMTPEFSAIQCQKRNTDILFLWSMENSYGMLSSQTSMITGGTIVMTYPDLSVSTTTANGSKSYIRFLFNESIPEGTTFVADIDTYWGGFVGKLPLITGVVSNNAPTCTIQY